MTLELVQHANGTWALKGMFDWYEPPEDAREQFAQAADDVAAMLTARLRAIVERIDGPTIQLGDERSMGGPWHYALALTPIGPSPDEWAAAVQYPAHQDTSPLADDLLQRYRLSLGHEQYLLTDANYCLTRLEDAAPPGIGKARDRASRRYGIDFAILRKMGELAALCGDNLSARKAPRRPLTEPERVWIREALRRVVIHVAYEDHSQQLPMSDLPPLS
jgi:hypothetical protein